MSRTASRSASSRSLVSRFIQWFKIRQPAQYIFAFGAAAFMSLIGLPLLVYGIHMILGIRAEPGVKFGDMTLPILVLSGFYLACFAVSVCMLIMRFVQAVEQFREERRQGIDGSFSVKISPILVFFTALWIVVMIASSYLPVDLMIPYMPGERHGLF